jgi:hypothetical protein
MALGHAQTILARLEFNIFLWLGNCTYIRNNPPPLSPELLAVLRKNESWSAIVATHRLHQNCSQIFRYAMATGRVERDVAADLRVLFLS